MTRKPTRRALLAGLSGVAACGPGAGARRPEGDEPDRTLAGTEDEASFPGGLRAGDPTAEGGVVSARTILPEVTLTLAARIGDGWVELPPWTGLVPVDGVIRVDVTDLAPDTEHLLVFTSPDGTVRSAPGTWRTWPEGRSRAVVFGATTCLGNENPAFPTLAGAAEEGLDFFLFVGDTIYTQARTLADYRDEYGALEATPSVRALLSTTPLVAVWDDHEVADDWSLAPVQGQTGVTPEQLAAATTAFREALPQREGPGGTGLWRSLTVGTTLELVLLDCRGERGDGRMASEAQLAWAVETLRASRCVFKLLVSSVHLTDHGTRLSWPDDRSDIGGRWQGYPAERERLLAALDAIPGAAVVSGGMHYGGIQRIGAAGEPGADRIEVAVGPAGSLPWDLAQWLADTDAGTEPYLDLVETWSWARFVADPVAGTLSVELVDDAGEVRASRALARL